MPAPHDAMPRSPTRRRLLGAGRPHGSQAAATPPRLVATATQGNKPPAAVRWLSKAGYGYTAADLDAFQALGGNDNARWSAWIDRQLDPGSINDGACEARINGAGFSTLNKTLPQLWADHHENPDWGIRMLPEEEVECATLIRATYSKRQLFERMVGFWHDHFSVYGRSGDTAPVFVHYDRDVIRTHALGNFRNLLGAVARSTAMQFYLDNYASRGANYNENYARELMELHTLGVENYYGPTGPFTVPCQPSVTTLEIHCEGSFPAGYVDNDVYEAAAALTGWTIKNGHWDFPNENDGTFVYRPSWHQHNNKFFLGLYLPANQPAMADGEQVFDRLCAHPGTARHIAGKLCRRFVGDSPSPALIDSVAATFTNHVADNNQIALMLGTILQSTEFRSSWGGGMKRPLETSVSALRALDADFTPVPDNSDAWTTTELFFSDLQRAGHRPFRWGPPNGYPDSMKAWSSSGSLAMTMKLLARLSDLRQNRNDDTSPYLSDIVAKTKAALAVADRSAAQITNWWCQQLLGWQPQPLTATVTAFMQQNAAANEPLDLDSDSWDTSNLKHHYVQQRLRTAVVMLLMNPEFLRR